MIGSGSRRGSLHVSTSKELFKPGDSADMNRPPVSPRNWIPLERPTVAFSGDSRYLTPLQVFISQSESMGLELGAANIDPNHQKILHKIATALKRVTFREQHVIAQFLSPHVVGKHRLLTTTDQPFGLGILNEGLCTYRQDSERYAHVLDNDHKEEDCSPVARVFERRLPEWTTDLNNYTLEQFPQQECAKGCNLHGYLALPVFDSTTRLCVGVVEILTSSGYIDYAYEVQNIHDALETVNLTSPGGFNLSALNVSYGHMQNDFDKIRGILETTCDVHSLPLAQAWTVSQHTSFVSHEKVIEKSCCSFHSRCVGKVCMSTTALPFYVRDLGMWPFLKACKERHLDSSHGLVGKALLTRGSYFCGDVTKLDEEEYPLVHYACMNKLTSCFAIFLHFVEANDDYVLEFFFPPDIKDSRHVLNLVQTLKQNIQLDSGFELGDTSSIVDVGPLTNLFVNMESHVSQTSSVSMADNFMFMSSSDSESLYSSDSESMYSPATAMVTAKITFNDDLQIHHFPLSLGLSNLKNEVAQRFELGGEILLKYMDEENDEILIANDVDLKFAVATVGSNMMINLICQPGI